MRNSRISSARAPAQRASVAMLAPCPFPTSQGTQVVIRHLATALARAGHDVFLITYAEREHDIELEFHVYRAPRAGTGLGSGPHVMKPAADAALMLTAARVIRAHRCSVIHAHNVEGLGVGALLKLHTGLPLVYHAHNAMGPELPTYFRAHFAQAFASIVGDVIDRTLPRAADAVVVFDDDHKTLHEIYGINASRIHVIPPGLDSGEIRGADPHDVQKLREKLGPGPWILYAGNADGYQNLPLLWQALRRVQQTRPDARLLLASHLPRSAFARDLRGEGIDAVVDFLRCKTLNELRAAHALASIGVCPRKLWTGAPIKVLNYLAAGLRVVACRSAGRHIVQGDKAGMLVADDPDEFAAAICRLLDAPLGARRASRLPARFEVDAHVASYRAVYAQAMGSDRPSDRSDQ